LVFFFSGLVASKSPLGASDDQVEIISKENAEVVVGYKEKIDGIKEVLARDHMKVVFFGR
jgi:mitofusin